MTTPIDPSTLYHLLNEHPQITLAYLAGPPLKPHITALCHPWPPDRILVLPQTLHQVPIRYLQGPRITDLRTYDLTPHAPNPHQACQDEPIQLGTQIQPAGAQWLGTAGAPAHWLDANGKHRYGILSNWHVMVPTPPQTDHPQHQPDTSRPACAYLDHYSKVLPDQVNYADCAIADALIDGLHTIAREIIGIGPLNPQPGDATIGLRVTKAGRTTQVTTATCTAIGAAVRVSYGTFDALFSDQDVYTDADTPFSAAGDSGSLIACQAAHRPISLLFAGGGNLTIGNPIRHVIDALGLDFIFP